MESFQLEDQRTSRENHFSNPLLFNLYFSQEFVEFANKCCRTNQKLHHHALFHFKFPIAQIAPGELLWYRVSKKWVLPKWAFADFSTNIIGISSQLAAGFPNAQFGKTQFFWDTLFKKLYDIDLPFHKNIFQKMSKI